MSAVLFSAAQLGLLAVAAPLLPGVIQTLKARLQGRRGPSPWQPYRDLGRLWSKSGVTPDGNTFVYRLAPTVVAAGAATALVVLAPGGLPLPGVAGHDAVVLIGLLALGRFALGASAWDTGGGFGLMGASRDLTIAIAIDGLLILCLALAALPASSTDLVAMSNAAAGGGPWTNPAHWCAAVAFALVVVAETGRQPVDNPDTHLELTMIHEGPLLEYAGRDLAYLQWSAAARHAIVLLLAADLFLPAGGSPAIHPLITVGWVAIGLGGLALTETLLAKMRILRVPVFAATGALIALAGLVAWYAGPAQ